MKSELKRPSLTVPRHWASETYCRLDSVRQPPTGVGEHTIYYNYLNFIVRPLKELLEDQTRQLPDMLEQLAV